MAAVEAGRPADAHRALDGADEALRASSPVDPFDAANVLLVRGRAHRLDGNLLAACSCATAAADGLRSISDADREGARLLVQALLDAADGHREAGRYDDARPLLTEAVEVCERRLGPADPEYASAYNSLGILERYTGRPAAADEAYARAEAACRELPDGDTDLAAVLHNRASLAHLQGRLTEARAAITEAMSLRGADAGGRAEDRLVLAAIVGDQGDYEHAEALMDDVASVLVDGSPRGDVHRAHLLADRALLAHRRGDLAEARRQYATARAVTADVLGPRHPQVAVVLVNGACCAADLGDDRAARAEAEAALELFAEHGADRLPSAALARQLLAEER